jgi:hypothetical protein
VRLRFLAERCVAAALLAAGLLLPAAALVRRRADPAITLLFVGHHCAACQAAAARLDSLAQLRRARRVVIVADSGNWSRLAPHLGIAIDSGHALARVLGIAAAPAWVTVTAVVRYDVDR